MNLRAYLLVPIIALVFLPVGWCGYKFFAVSDTVIVSNTSGHKNGILVVGNASPPMFYKSFTSATNNLLIGQVTRARVNNEVAAFTNGRAVATQTPVAWASGADTVKLNFTGPIRIDVSVWVVSGDYAQQHRRYKCS